MCRRVCWALAAAALLLAVGVVYYDAKARAARTELDRVTAEHLRMTRVLENFGNILQELSGLVANHPALRQLLVESGFEVRIHGPPGAPTAGSPP